jgi:hypothetical protein
LEKLKKEFTTNHFHPGRLFDNMQQLWTITQIEDPALQTDMLELEVYLSRETRVSR